MENPEPHAKKGKKDGATNKTRPVKRSVLPVVVVGSTPTKRRKKSDDPQGDTVAPHSKHNSQTKKEQPGAGRSAKEQTQGGTPSRTVRVDPGPKKKAVKVVSKAPPGPAGPGQVKPQPVQTVSRIQTASLVPDQSKTLPERKLDTDSVDVTVEQLLRSCKEKKAEAVQGTERAALEWLGRQQLDIVESGILCAGTQLRQFVAAVLTTCAAVLTPERVATGGAPTEVVDAMLRKHPKTQLQLCIGCIHAMPSRTQKDLARQMSVRDVEREMCPWSTKQTLSLTAMLHFLSRRQIRLYFIVEQNGNSVAVLMDGGRYTVYYSAVDNTISTLAGRGWKTLRQQLVVLTSKKLSASSTTKVTLIETRS